MKSRLASIAYFAVGMGFAQIHPRSVEVQLTQVLPGALSVRTGALVNRVQEFQKVNGAAWSSHGDELFGMAENATRDIFRFDQLHLQARSVKTGTPTGDLLVSVWNFAAQNRTGKLYLIDSPILSTYSISIADVSPNEMGEFLASRLNWEIFPGMRPHRLEISVEPSGNAFFDKLVLGSSTDAHLMRLQGARQGGNWYLQLVLGKGLLRSHYQEVAFVPERIPPLAHSVKTWSQSRIKEQLSTRETSPRSLILFQELVSRDPSDSVLIDLLLKAGYLDWELDQRFDQIVKVLRQADPNLARMRQFTEASLREFERIGPMADLAAGHAFPGTCEDPRYEVWAARMLSSRSLQRAPLRYLAACGISAETEAVLSRIDLPRDIQALRAEALEAVRSRTRRAADKPKR